MIDLMDPFTQFTAQLNTTHIDPHLDHPIILDLVHHLVDDQNIEITTTRNPIIKESIHHDQDPNQIQTHTATVVVKQDTKQKNAEQITIEYKNIKQEKHHDSIDTKNLSNNIKEKVKKHG